MGKTFNIDSGSLGGIWGLVTLNAPILSKDKESHGFPWNLEQNVRRTLNTKYLNGYHWI